MRLVALRSLAMLALVAALALLVQPDSFRPAAPPAAPVDTVIVDGSEPAEIIADVADGLDRARLRPVFSPSALYSSSKGFGVGGGFAVDGVLSLGIGARGVLLEEFGVVLVEGVVTATMGAAYDDVFREFTPRVRFANERSAVGERVSLSPSLAVGVNLHSLDRERPLIGALVGLGPGGVTLASLRLVPGIPPEVAMSHLALHMPQTYNRTASLRRPLLSRSDSWPLSRSHAPPEQMEPSTETSTVRLYNRGAGVARHRRLWRQRQRGIISQP